MHDGSHFEQDLCEKKVEKVTIAAKTPNNEDIKDAYFQAPATEGESIWIRNIRPVS